MSHKGHVVFYRSLFVPMSCSVLQIKFVFNACYFVDQFLSLCHVVRSISCRFLQVHCLSLHKVDYVVVQNTMLCRLQGHCYVYVMQFCVDHCFSLHVVFCRDKLMSSMFCNHCLSLFHDIFKITKCMIIVCPYKTLHDIVF